MEQVYGMQHGAVAAEHDDQRQLPGQLRAHAAASASVPSDEESTSSASIPWLVR